MRMPYNIRKKLIKSQLGMDLDQKMFYEIGHNKNEKHKVLLRFFSEPLSQEEMNTIWDKLVKPLTKKPFSVLLLHKKYEAEKDQLEKIEPIFIDQLKVYDYFKGKDYRVVTVSLHSIKFEENEGVFTFEVIFRGIRTWD